MQTLKANLALNGINDRTETHQVGVGNKTGREPFYMTNKGNTSSFINREDQSGIRTAGVTMVDIIRLDEFFASRNKSIDYVRMDVEGYELEVIDGMSKLLTEGRGPQLMFIEVHSELLHRRNSSGREFISHLAKHGYEVSKSFWRGRADIAVTSTEAILNHELLEVGYWETFFKKRA
jgi:FkbM family methyltransferase